MQKEYPCRRRVHLARGYVYAYHSSKMAGADVSAISVPTYREVGSRHGCTSSTSSNFLERRVGRMSTPVHERTVEIGDNGIGFSAPTVLLQFRTIMRAAIAGWSGPPPHITGFHCDDAHGRSLATALWEARSASGLTTARQSQRFILRRAPTSSGAMPATRKPGI